MPKRKMGRPMQGLSQRQVAEMLDISQTSVSRMKRDGALETYPDGSIVADSVPGAGESSRPPQERGKVLSYHEARTRVESLKAEKLAFEIEVQRGRFVSAKAVEDTATGLYYMVGEALDAAVERLSSLIASRYALQEPELRKMIGDHIFEARERLADELETIADEPA